MRRGQARRGAAAAPLRWYRLQQPPVQCDLRGPARQGAIGERSPLASPPVVARIGGEAIVVHAVGMLGLSFDHRAVDGAYASAFLARVGEILETRPWDVEI